MVMCEKPLGRNATRIESDRQGRGGRGVAQHGLVQLSPDSRGYGWPRNSSAKENSQDLSLSRQVSSGLTFFFPSDLPQGGEGLWRLDVNVAGSGVTGDLLAHTIDTAMWLTVHPGSFGAHRDVHQGAHTISRKDGEGWYRRRQFVSSAVSNGSLASFEATRYARATGRCTRLKSMASTPPSCGTCMICTGCSISIITTKVRARMEKLTH